MANIGNHYSVFEKHELISVLRNIFARKPDTEWRPLSLSIISSTLLLATIVQKISKTTSPSGWLYVALSILSILILVLAVWFIRSFKKWIRDRSISEQTVIEKVLAAQVPHDRTALLVVKRTFDTTPKMLVRENKYWGCMLPYCKPQREGDLALVKAAATNIFGCTEIMLERLNEIDIPYEIKANPREGKIERYSFTFFHVKFQIDFNKFMALMERVSHAGYAWRSLNEMAADPKTMSSNSDVVSRLSGDYAFDRLDDSFSLNTESKSTLPPGLKVIWNITSKCSYQCGFCGTFRQEDEGFTLPIEQRLRIATELVRLPGVRLDFAGGDPLYDKESQEAILHIVKFMLKEGACLTTTGKGIEKLYSRDSLTHFNVIDISYDYPSTWDTAKHRSADYNRQNYFVAKELTS